MTSYKQENKKKRNVPIWLLILLSCIAILFIAGGVFLLIKVTQNINPTTQSQIDMMKQRTNKYQLPSVEDSQKLFEKYLKESDYDSIYTL
jgi:beta-lactamase regulating signal transducer with metallopeptidase domain